MQKNIDSVYYNYEGYYDPTAGRALDRVSREDEAAAGMEKASIKMRKRKKYKRNNKK